MLQRKRRDVTLLRLIPALAHYSDIVSYIFSGSTYGKPILRFFLAYTLKFYLTYLMALYLVSILTCYLTFFLGDRRAPLPLELMMSLRRKKKELHPCWNLLNLLNLETWQVENGEKLLSGVAHTQSHTDIWWSIWLMFPPSCREKSKHDQLGWTGKRGEANWPSLGVTPRGKLR